jgi:hypothetical protein
MGLDDLNRSVTDAILRAEALPPGSWDAERAFREVMDLEEEIATIVGAQTVEGEVARLGAVSAALSAGEPLRALQLSERYLPDALSDSARAKLEDLAREAEAEVDRGLAKGATVAPVRFQLRAA